jgi:SDR family mycofactocin-dependent oxidoreductase
VRLLEGKVALITGAARGQGRSHAVRLAEEGANIIALDICADISTVPYPLASLADLEETAVQVRKRGAQIVTAVCDVRDPAQIEASLAAGLAEFGGLDIVLANAGVCPINSPATDAEQFRDVIDINLNGVWNTVRPCIPILIDQGRGGSIVLTSSTGGLKGLGGSSGGGEGYTASKHGVVGLMRTWATQLGQHNIRVNSIHPTGVATGMILNDVMRDFIAHDDSAARMTNLLPIDILEPVDVSNAICFLVSDRARYVTGVTLPVDAGLTTK